MNVSNKPRKAQAKTNARRVWFYENPKSIDVYIETDERFVCSCRIPRRILVDWIDRTRENK